VAPPYPQAGGHVRILVVQESDWIERGPHQSHHLFERLQQRGHAIRVVDFDIGWRNRPRANLMVPRRILRAPPKVVEGSAIEVVRPPTIAFPVLDYASAFLTHRLEIGRQIREFRPEILIGFGILNAFSGIRLAHRAEIPFVYYLIDELHQLVPQQAFRGVAHLFEQANVREASLVLAINQALVDYAVEMGAGRERARVLPAGIDLERYLSAGDGVAVRKRLGLDPEDLVLFFMGWVYPFSGIRDVAECLIAGEGRDDRVRLLVVGKGDAWDELAALVRGRGAEDRIKMIGFRPYAEMPSYLAAANICLLHAHPTETMRNIVPIKMYEYLAAGKPVIATELPGLAKEFGRDAGVIYVPGPREVVSKAIELDRSGRLQALGQQGRAFVSHNDWKTITDSFESYLVELIKRGGPSS